MQSLGAIFEPLVPGQVNKYSVQAFELNNDWHYNKQSSTESGAEKVLQIMC